MRKEKPEKLNSLMAGLLVKKPAIVAVLALLLVLVLVTVTVAVFTQNKLKDQGIYSTNLIVNPHVFFLQDNGSEIPGTDFQDNGYYIADVSDPSSPNYITKLRVNVRLKGSSKAYMRIYMQDMWITNQDEAGLTIPDTVMYRENTDYKFSSSEWLDNRLFDNYFYYNETTRYGRGIIQNTGDTVYSFPFILGLNEDVSPIDGGRIYFEVRAETVQFNRLNEIWGVSDLPTPLPSQSSSS